MRVECDDCGREAEVEARDTEFDVTVAHEIALPGALWELKPDKDECFLCGLTNADMTLEDIQ